ncbi:MAG TPA: hypothetical protein PKC18_16785 [Lacipirellulaceae bacterium]|nr:hypothetical protein [Lacipirellulaceae bacterium]
MNHAKVLLHGRDGIRFHKHRGQFQIIYRDSVAIIPKKLKLAGRGRTRLSFSSYDSDQNKSHWAQQPTEGFDDLPRVMLGYLPQKEMTEIKTMVLYPRGKFIRFCYLIPDQSSGIKLHEAHEDVSPDVATSRGFDSATLRL